MSVVPCTIVLSKKEGNPMEQNLDVMIATVDTDCQCNYFDEDLDTFVAMESCEGDCYYWQKEDVMHVIGEWQLLNEIDEDDKIIISGTGIGWQSRSGYKETDILELHGALALNGDFRITWTLDIPSKKLTARRSSHDEPMGANFEIDFIKTLPCNECGDLMNAEIHAEELGMCIDCSNAYFTHADEEEVEL
jgi:hypothetical protein